MMNKQEGEAMSKRKSETGESAPAPTQKAAPTLAFLRAVVQPFPRLGASAITELGNVSDEAGALEFVMRWPGPIRSAAANKRRELIERG